MKNYFLLDPMPHVVVTEDAMKHCQLCVPARSELDESLFDKFHALEEKKCIKALEEFEPIAINEVSDLAEAAIKVAQLLNTAVNASRTGSPIRLKPVTSGVAAWRRVGNFHEIGLWAEYEGDPWKINHTLADPHGKTTTFTGQVAVTAHLYEYKN